MTTISVIDIVLNLAISVLVYKGELWWVIHLLTLTGILGDAFGLYELNQTLIDKKIKSIPQFIMTCFTVLDAFVNGYIVWFSLIAGTWFASWKLILIGMPVGLTAFSLDFYFLYLLNFKLESI